jgi:histidyl-tRNA synthetase
VAVDSEETRATAIEVAEQLRARGISSEVAPRAEKFGRQIRYADRRSIPYVWFGGTVGGEVKDIRTGEQVAADPKSWIPGAEDLKPKILSLTPSS